MIYFIVAMGAVVLFLCLTRFGVLLDALPRREREEDERGD